MYTLAYTHTTLTHPHTHAHIIFNTFTKYNRTVLANEPKIIY